MAILSGNNSLFYRLKPRLNFIRLHYVWITFCSLLAFPVLYSYGNMTAIDALFFGCSGSTESGLNTVDVKDIKLYQQVYIYIIPIITNLMFINAMVVPFRLYWFRKHLKGVAKSIGRVDEEDRQDTPSKQLADARREGSVRPSITRLDAEPQKRRTTIKFDEAQKQARGRSDERQDSDLARLDKDEGNFETGELPNGRTDDTDEIKPITRSMSSQSRRRALLGEGAVARAAARSLENIATSAFVLGDTGKKNPRRSISQSRKSCDSNTLPQLSRQVTIGRNSQFYNLSEEDRERLGGIEYRALKLLAKFVFGYLIGLHLLGVICLVPWIHSAGPKYTDWLEEVGAGKTWWAIYSAQTMVDNLGFTLTPDSMATFKDATWPMLVMTFLAFAGNTLYPCCLRLLIWSTSKLVPKHSQTQETIQFLLQHPRRCYTLLFPSRPTWILFGIVAMLNFVDVVLIVCLDLNNPAVNDLAMGPRILSALFQAASARHTGTATLNLAQVNPAVQFSLLTMMYIAIFPIAISIRASNTDEERTLGIWSREGDLDERSYSNYVMVHIRNQLTFDLWYIFLGTFLICIVEADRIMDLNEPSFSLFPVLFEVTSAYGNVGLSLGGPSGSVSMSGHYQVVSKLVICAMMIRGRHRGLPYALDRAINLPSTDAFTTSSDDDAQPRKIVEKDFGQGAAPEKAD